MEILGFIWFLLIGICGCVYPFITDKHEPFHKSDKLYCDGDNT